MIEFDQDFFKPEIRCDFYIDETMKTCWAAEMELLYDIDVVCEKYDIPYYVYYGTLLGTVRHQGFVPWDDDIDIAMFREDFDKLMSVLRRELPSEYVIHNPLADDDATEYWACVSNSDSVSIEPTRLEKFHGCPFIAGVDIYPLDFVPRDEAVRERVRKEFHMVWTTRRLALKEDKTEEEKETLEVFLQEIERSFHIKFDRSKPIVGQLVRLANHIAASVKEEDGDGVAMYIDFTWGNMNMDKNWFSQIDWLPFENIYVPVPHEYDAVLTARYGDYKTPRPNTQSHDYPFYKKQLEELRQKAEAVDKA